MFKTRTIESRGQLTLAVTLEEAKAIREHRRDLGFEVSGRQQTSIDDSNGYFYIIRLLPELAPCRVKLGFSNSVKARLRTCRTATPTAELVQTWPCKRVWEKAAIDSVTRKDCLSYSNEVFDCDSVEKLLLRCHEFFALMP